MHQLKCFITEFANDVMDALEACLADMKVKTVRIDGGTPVAKRQPMIDALKEGDAQAGILSFSACGTGLTLCPGVWRMFFTDMNWSPAGFQQAEDRAHLIGATRPVECFYLVASDGYDYDMLQILQRKSTVNAAVLDDAKSSFLFEE